MRSFAASKCRRATGDRTRQQGNIVPLKDADGFDSNLAVVAQHDAVVQQLQHHLLLQARMSLHKVVRQQPQGLQDKRCTSQTHR